MTRGDELHCPSCGHLLARVVSERSIATDEGEFLFSRGTDHIACDNCGMMVPVREVRQDLVRGDVLELLHELSADDAPPAATEEPPDADG